MGEERRGGAYPSCNSGDSDEDLMWRIRDRTMVDDGRRTTTPTATGDAEVKVTGGATTRKERRLEGGDDGQAMAMETGGGNGDGRRRATMEKTAGGRWR